MLFPLLLIFSLSEEADCDNFFRVNHEICSQSQEYIDATINQKFPCSLRISLASPVGWYKYDTIPTFYYNFFETDANIDPTSKAFISRNPDPINVTAVNTSNKASDFVDFCPMYDASSKDPKLEGRQTCCKHLVKSYFDRRDATYYYSNYDLFKKHALFRILPKCYDLIRYMPCAMCHPKVHLPNISYIVKLDKTSSFDVDVPIRTYRICNRYAEEIWHQCRRSFYLTDGKKLIVPEDMGLEQFKDLVGVPEYHGLESDQCLDIEDVNPFY